jgi:uncharacterized protein (TIGR00297 family)
VTDAIEDRRQVVHIAMGGWALALRWMTWPQAAALATLALLFNWLVLPHVGGRSLYRAADQARGFPIGILLYPFAILLLVLIFRARLDLVALVWGVLAAGDGFATLIGRRSRGPRLPWNSEKSVAGTLAFATTGAVAGAFLGWWSGLGLDSAMSFGLIACAAVAAAVGAAFVESIPVRLDDNISVTAAAALIAWCVSLTDEASWTAQAGDVASRLPLALLTNGLVGAAGYAARTVSVSGLAAGVIIGTLVYAGAGAGAWLLLVVAFAAAALTSRVGYRRKLQLGIAEERGGRRGAGNAIANTGLAALAAVLCVTTPYRVEALFALAAALIAGSSDTVASEIGKAFGRRTFLVVGFRPVPPGTSGALSLEGTAAGVAAAAVLGLVAVRAGLAAPDHLLVLVAAATTASLVESALGATLEAPRVLNNDVLNFINTAAAAGLALLMVSRLR